MVFPFAFLLQTGGFEYRLHHRHRPHEVAGGAPADLNLARGGRLEAEVGIKRGDGPNIVDRRCHKFRDPFDRFPRDIVQFVFHRQKGRQNGDRRLALTADGPVYSLFQTTHRTDSWGKSPAVSTLLNGRDANFTGVFVKELTIRVILTQSRFPVQE